jgi:large subunit ribosomal protein L9
MEVILQDNVSNLGFVGDIVKVKSGYARNFLFPKKLALPADKKNIAEFEHHKKAIEVKKAKKKSEAAELKKRIEALEIVVAHAAGEGEKLFGSVTASDIQQELVAKGFNVDRKLIRVETQIKTIGVHEVEVVLHQEVSAVVKVKVEAKAE